MRLNLKKISAQARKTAVDRYRVSRMSIGFVECLIKHLANLQDGDSITVTRDGEFYSLMGVSKT